MTMISTLSPLATVQNTATTSGKSMSDLGQADFFRLLTVQIQQQDPLDPVDNKEMLAQMAQFSSLSGITDVNETLKAMSDKLDKLIDAGQPVSTAATLPATAPTISKEA